MNIGLGCQYLFSPTVQASALPAAAQTVLVVLTALLAAAVLALVIYLLRTRRERAEELAALADIQASIAAAPPDAAEIAETSYVMSAHLLETDFFQLGLFENDGYRTLIWIKDGDRQDNLSFPLKGADGIVGWMRDTGQALLVKDFEGQRNSLPARPSYDSADPPSSGVFAPLKSGGRVVGAIIVQSRRRAAFTPHHLQILVQIAASVAAALASVGFERQLDERGRQAALLTALSRELIAFQPLPERYARIASMISQLFGDSAVRLFECRDGAIELRAAWPEVGSMADPGFAEPGPTVERAVRERGRFTQHETLAGEAIGATTLAIPLEAEGSILGVLELRIPGDPGVSGPYLEVAGLLASQLGVALAEMRAYNQQQEYTWITTVLLEVARHASQPGDVEGAIQAVLQLTTLLVGTSWAMVLLPQDGGGGLRLGSVAGPKRQVQDQLAGILVDPEELIEGPISSDGTPCGVDLPPQLAGPLGTQDATCVPLGDGARLLGVLLVDGRGHPELQLSLLTGIARQVSLRIENTRLMEEAAVRKSLENELAVARGIQESFLPKVTPAFEGWEVKPIWRVARSVGGDFYDFIPLSPGPDGPRLGVVVADVADKGVPAALFMALCRTLLRSVAIRRVDPGLTLKRMNDLIFADTQTDLFVSVFYSVWEPNTSRLTYANGGHNPPILFSRGAQPRLLTEHGMVLGVSEGQTYQTHTVTLPSDSALLMYTDGLTEAAGKDGTFFGLQRLTALVRDLSDWSAEGLASEITRGLIEFVGDPDPTDDMTAVIIRRQA
jgi:serine phosphatase RsbU (regulator of sigma subunit)